MRKSVAKKIIINPPLSIRYSSAFLPRRLATQLEGLDMDIQDWALAQSDFFSEEDWREVQRKKLGSLLVHAGDNVSFWNRIFNDSGFEPRRFKNLDDLEKLPVTSRAHLKKAGHEDLTASNIPQSRMIRTATSGSTAEPFVFLDDRRGIFRYKVNVFLELRYIDVPAQSNIVILGLGGIKGLRHYPLRIDPREIESREWRMHTLYPLLTSARPEILFSTPSYIRRLAHFCGQDGFRYSFAGIRYCGESMDLTERDELENFFQCGIYSTYGSHECSIIGIECKNRNMHTVPWLNYVEIVDGNGNVLPYGQVGNIVVTFFENECMPFIRYVLGDRGSILKEKCSCGRSSALLQLEGRVLGFLEFRDRSIYHVSYVVAYIAKNFSDSICRFQLEQPEPTKIIFRYVPQKQRVEVEKRLDKYFSSFLNGRAEITYEAVDYIQPDARGKTKIFIKS